jgi:hypothetical protein
MRRAMTVLVGFCLLLGGWGLPSTAEAADKVGVKVHVVHATKAHSKVDPKVKKLAKHYRRLGYTGFRLLDSEQVQLAPKSKKTVSIIGGREMTITVLSRGPKRARLRVQVQGKRGKLVDTTVSIRRNGMMIVAGPRHKNGILVLPIWARY